MTKKLLKLLLRSLLFFIVIFLIVGLIGYLTASFWVKPVISSLSPKLIKTNVTIESADISIFSGRFTLKGLKVSNLEGFSEPYIFELGEVSVNFQPKSLFTNNIIVDKVLIKENIAIAEYNMKGQMNLLVFDENVQSSLSKGESSFLTQNQIETEQKSETKSDKVVIIKDLQILNTRLRFAMMGRSSTLNLPDIQEKNIGEKETMTLNESVSLISKKLTLDPIEEMTKMTQTALKDALKVIENHTTDRDAVKKLKGVLSNINFF